jgi:hypothetical protein
MNAYHIESVKAYADRWRSLRSWGAPLDMLIRVEAHKGGKYLGLAKSYACAAIVYCTGSLALDLATAVHEMAHLAAPDSEKHGRRWREVFVRAAAEAFDCDVDDFDVDVKTGDLDAQVEDAARNWLASR